MSEMLNDRDAILQAAAVRIVNPKNASILLTAVPAMFHLDGAGQAEAAEVTVTARLLGLEGNVTFTVDGASLSSVTGSSAVVRLVDMQGPTAIVRATMMAGGEQFTGACVIGTLRDGASGGSASVIVLTPSQHVFKIGKDGANSPDGITLTATGQNLSGTPSFTVPVGTATLSAGANSLQKILTFANMTTDSVTVQVAQDGVSDRVTIVKLREGADGAPGADAIVGLLSNESVTLPDSSAGVVSSYSGATCSMTVYKGAADDSANWAYAFSPASAAARLAYTASGRAVTITGIAADVDTAYVDITATKAGAASITKRFTVTKSRAGASITGARGAGHYYAAGETWSDSIADAATPSGNVAGDVVTISSGTYVMEKRWTGSEWVDNGVVIPGNLIVPGSILGSAIRAGTLDIRAPDGRLLLGANGDFGGTVRASNLQVGTDQNNLIADPRFKDLAWWGIFPSNNAGITPVDWNGTAQGSWPRYNVSMYFQSTGGVQYNTETKKMPLIPGATYLIEYDLLFHNDWDGDFSVWFSAANWTGNLLGGLGIIPDSPYPFADGNGIQYPAYTREWRRVSTVITIPGNLAAVTEGSFIFLRSIRSGSVEMGAFNLIRLLDSVLIKDGAITANKIQAKAITADKINVNEISSMSPNVGELSSRAGGQGAGTIIRGDQIIIFDEGGNIRELSGRLW